MCLIRKNLQLNKNKNMKSLNDYLNESINEAQKLDRFFLTDGDHCISITDINGDYIMFDEKDVNKIYKKNKWWENKGFIKDMFDKFSDADVMWYEEIEGSGDDIDTKPLKSVSRDQQDKGWQDEK